MIYQVLAFTVHGKTLKGHIRIINLKYQLQHEMKNLNCLKDLFYIRYSRLFWIYVKKSWGKTVNPSVGIYINKIENRITCEIKTGFYLEILTPETMKLLGSTKSEITKNENGENVPYLEITEVILIHCYVVNNTYQQSQQSLAYICS